MNRTPGPEGLLEPSHKAEMNKLNSVAQGALYALSDEGHKRREREGERVQEGDGGEGRGRSDIKRETHNIRKVAIIDLEIHHGKK